MKHNTRYFVILLIAVVVLASSCSGSKRGFCGCPNEMGMSGYK